MRKVNRYIYCILLVFSCESWAEIDLFEQEIAQSKAYLQQGQYQLALKTVEATAPKTQAQVTQKEGFLGLLNFQTHKYDKAKILLQNAIHQKSADLIEQARWQATLANLESLEGDTYEAKQLYTEALKESMGDSKLSTQIHLGLASLMPIKQRLEELSRITSQLKSLNNQADYARFLVNIGSQALSLGAEGVNLAFYSFEQASKQAEHEPRLLAEAWGGMAQLYEEDQRNEEALRLNVQAIKAAQSVDASDLLIDLEWRSARLNQAIKQPLEALAAYQRTIQHIESIRQDIPIEFADGRSSFRDTLEPIYLGLAGLEIEIAKNSQGNKQTLKLQETRQTIETLKQSEMEDFLGGRCALMGAKHALLEVVEPQTAIIYPIIFPNRLELLVSIGNEVKLFSEGVSSSIVQSTAHNFATRLREEGDNYQVFAQKLYQWLIAPEATWLHEHQVKTLVIVPDGALRLIPLAALYDGSHYLIEQYALATSPGLTIIEPVPIHRVGVKSLLAGLSVPGPVLDHLPPEFKQGLTNNGQQNSQSNHRGGPSRGLQIIQSHSLHQNKERTFTAEYKQNLKDQLRLPGVNKEITTLSRQLPNTALLDENFTVIKFMERAKQEHFPIVHIASHGVFQDSAEASFLMAYDDVIKFDELEKLFKSDNFKNNPLELLTLSACQTAEGDERAPLGLSGLAIKAKVRSALGSLWSVSDEATYRLMGDFYQQLTQPNIGKAQALRLAQMKLLKEKQFSHPYYWSPFILVGNWL